MPIFLKSGSLNVLPPSGPDQAYNGIALPLVLLLDIGRCGASARDTEFTATFRTIGPAICSASQTMYCEQSADYSTTETNWNTSQGLNNR
jgi:hypothetical protein